MNVIVSNKQKNVLDNANIDAIKDLNGLFNVDELINNFKGYFFSKMIIDATAIVDFAKESVLRKLVSSIGADKIILLLPPKPEPPAKFKQLLISLGVYNFTTNIDDVLRFLKTPNTLENVDNGNPLFNNDNNYESNNNDDMSNNFSANTSNMMDNNMSSNNTFINNNINNLASNMTVVDKNNDRKLVIGFKNVTEHAGSTTLIYMIKTQLEKDFKINALAIEVGKNDFTYFNNRNMISVSNTELENAIRASQDNIVLVDLNDTVLTNCCDEIIYLIEPSIIKINKLFAHDYNALVGIHDKKVVLNKSMLTSDDVTTFGKEAGLNISFNMPFVNDREDSKVVNDLINALGLTQGSSHNIFGLLK